MNAVLFSAKGLSCVNCNLECLTEQEAMNRDSHTAMRAGVSKSSSFKFLNTNELVKIIAANPTILFRIREASPLQFSFEAFP